MIEISDQGRDMQRSSQAYVMSARVESWLDGVLLADDVPISAGVEYGDRSARVPERVMLTVPRVAAGYDWSPIGTDHPLAANGQRLRILLGVGLVGREIEWIQRGEFLIQQSAVREDEIQVEAVGLLALIDEARLVAPYQPTGTLKSTLRGLVEPALTVVFDAGLTDRAVPSGINYDEDRLGAVQELLNAWPAEAQVTNEGFLYVQAPPTLGVAFDRHFFGDSTAIRITGDSDRDGAINCVVARGTASDGGQVQGVAYNTSTGPHRFGGPFNPLPVPEFLASPLLTTVAQCQAAARTRLARKQREYGRPMEVTAPPWNFVQLGDEAVADVEPENVFCTVEAYQIPYLAGGGPMTVTLVEIPS